MQVDLTVFKENEKIFVCDVPFQFVGSAECLLFHLLSENCALSSIDKFALTGKLKLRAYLPYIQR